MHSVRQILGSYYQWDGREGDGGWVISRSFCGAGTPQVREQKCVGRAWEEEPAWQGSRTGRNRTAEIVADESRLPRGAGIANYNIGPGWLRLAQEKWLGF
jgi:hypothetical protein